MGGAWLAHSSRGGGDGMRKIIAFMGAVALLFGGVGCDKKTKDLTVYMPDGAPALALAKMMAEDTEDDGVTYRVVLTSAGNANSIASKVTYKDEGKNADFCVLPLTAASKLLGGGENYTMLGTVTHGNLYLLSKNEENIEDLSKLVGKTIGVLQINEVPGLTLKATLKKKGVAYQEVTSISEIATDKVNLFPITGADAVGVGYDNGQGGLVLHDYYLVAEPAASFQANKKGYRMVGDLQALYGGESGYPQAVLVGKKSVVEARAEWTKNFVENIKNSEEWLRLASGETLVAAVASHLEDRSAQTSLKAPLLTTEAVSRCGIYFTYAKDTRLETEGFLKDLLAVNNKAAAIPSEEFYWK